MTTDRDPWAQPRFPEPLAEGQHVHPRPQDSVLNTARANVAGSCPECGVSQLESYRVLSEGGWWNVVKCQSCLESISREPAALFGSYSPLGLCAPIRFGKATV